MQLGLGLQVVKLQLGPRPSKNKIVICKAWQLALCNMDDSQARPKQTLQDVGKLWPCCT